MSRALAFDSGRVATEYTIETYLVLLPQGPSDGAEATSVSSLEQSWLHIGTTWSALGNNLSWDPPQKVCCNWSGCSLGIRIFKVPPPLQGSNVQPRLSSLGVSL